MIPDEIRQQLQHIIKGAILEGSTDSCSTIRNHLIKSFGASATVKGQFESKAIIKERENHFLKDYAQNNGLWLETEPPAS